MNPIILPPEYKNKLVFPTFVLQLDQKMENSNFKPFKHCVKMTLCRTLLVHKGW